MVGKLKAMSYEEWRAQFRWQVPEYFNWVVDVFDTHSKNPKKIALHWVDETGIERKISFAELTAISKRFSSILQTLGLSRGDRVFVMLPTIPEWWEIALACIRTGVVLMPAIPLLTPRDIKHRLTSSSATTVVTDAVGAAKVDEVRREAPSVKQFILVGGAKANWKTYEKLMRKPTELRTVEKTKSSDPMIIYFTSGTSGYPKMVLHTQASYGIGHVITERWLNISDADVHWTITGTGWAKHAFSNLFAPWNAGATVFAYHYEGRFDSVMHLDLLEKYEVTSFCAPPTAWRLLVLENLSRFNFPHLREVTSAGEPLNPEIIEKWRKATGLTIRDGYGQTEVVIAIANFPGMKVKPGSMGKSSPGLEVSVIDEKGNEVPQGVEGDIAIRVRPDRPVGMFQEYINDPERTSRSYRGDWYVTDDRAYRDEEGYFWFLGRGDDVIKSSGYRIGPFEIESVLIEHPAVAEVAVVASPDELKGFVVKAFVVLKQGYTSSKELETELIEFTKKQTAPYKHPRRVEFISELPKTATGKIRRNELRAIELERYRAAKTERAK